MQEKTEEEFVELRDASARQDAVEYRRLCDHLGCFPQTEAGTQLYDQGEIGRLEQRIKTSQKPIEKVTKPKTIINYDVFWKLANDDRLMPENVFEQIEWKRDILEKAGYTHLIGSKRERVTIGSAKDTRIGLAFRNTYRTAEKRKDKRQ